ncbi:PQQ-dependent sugar dehydrogenase [Synoicihabitans lomoniglobus]|uniref:PQQ-dependent sugar dehydrogenase n=1 Tax=Synoicihabitans lomoniglobus TaxID=2909285 RepID=A0AAF0CQ96_9BACT|nr:PQQ-dependent sugar dehydrogenase [Opitutaceae bacterium LMO-M01]
MLLALAMAGVASVAAAALTPAPDNGGISLPGGFKAAVVADDLGGIRGIAVAPNGDVYGRVRGRGIVAMRDTDGDGTADIVETIPGSTGEGSGIGIQPGYLYYSTNSGVFRYARAAGELLPSGEPEAVATDLSDKGQHNAKMFTFDEYGMLYVEVGSPSNALGVPDRARGAQGVSDAEVAKFLSEHGGVWKFDPSKAPQTQQQGEHWSTGHRHILALAWNPVSHTLFGAMNGRDTLDVINPDLFSKEYNAVRVAEEFHELKKGANLGWPRTFYDPIGNKRLFGAEYGGDGKKGPPAGSYPDPIIAFPAHWAPMQMAYYGGEQFPETYRGGLFQAFHGSWNRQGDQKGYNVSFIPFDASGRPTGEWSVFADGFMGTGQIASPNDAAYRPMGLAAGPDGSLYVGSDHGGRVWRIFYIGE